MVADVDYLGVDVFQDLLNAAVLLDQVDGPLGTDSLDGAAVVTAQQDTQVYELQEEKGGVNANISPVYLVQQWLFYYYTNYCCNISLPVHW